MNLVLYLPFLSIFIFHSRFASVCTYTRHIFLQLWNLILDGNHECRWRRRQKYIRQSESSRRCTYGDHNPTVVCTYMRTIIAYGGRVGRIESMTSCQSRNSNLAAKRGTSQLPATANNLDRSRSSAIHERVSTYAAAIIENRRSIRRDLHFRGGNIVTPLRVFPRLLFRIPAKLLTLTIKTICASYLGVIKMA